MADASIVKIDVKDADRIVVAVSEEAMKWLDKLTKGAPGKVDHWSIAPDVHWPTTPLKKDTVLQFTLDHIDDKADAFFNHKYVDTGDQNKPLSFLQRVQHGSNLLAVAIYNTGGFKWGVQIDIRPPHSKPFYFHRHIEREDDFKLGQGVATHVLLLTFDGQ